MEDRQKSARPTAWESTVDGRLTRRLMQPMRLAQTRSPVAQSLVARVEETINRLPLVDEMSRKAEREDGPGGDSRPIVAGRPAPSEPGAAFARSAALPSPAAGPRPVVRAKRFEAGPSAANLVLPPAPIRSAARAAEVPPVAPRAAIQRRPSAAGAGESVAQGAASFPSGSPPSGIGEPLARRLVQPLRLAQTRTPIADTLLTRVEGTINRLPLVDEMSRRAEGSAQPGSAGRPVADARPARGEPRPPAPPARSGAPAPAAPAATERPLVQARRIDAPPAAPTATPPPADPPRGGPAEPVVAGRPASPGGPTPSGSRSEGRHGAGKDGGGPALPAVTVGANMGTAAGSPSPRLIPRAADPSSVRRKDMPWPAAQMPAASAATPALPVVVLPPHGPASGGAATPGSLPYRPAAPSLAARPSPVARSSDLPLRRPVTPASIVEGRISRMLAPTMNNGVIQRDGETQYAPMPPPTPEPSNPSGAAALMEPAGDVDEMVERVMRKLMRQLAITGERKGLTRWTS